VGASGFTRLAGVEELRLSAGKSNSALKVCAFSYYFPPHFSGAGLYAFTLAKEFAKKGIRFTFVTVDNTGLPQRDTYQGFEVYRVADGERKHGEFVLWWNLWRTFSSLKDDYDIIHAFGSTYRNSVVGPIGKTLGKKSLTTVSLAKNDLYPMSVGTTAGRIQKRFLRCVDRYVSLSRQITDEIRTLPLEFHKAVEIPQGVDTSRFYPADSVERAGLRQQLELPPEPLALYVGVLDSRKNVKWLVETWIRNREVFAQWRLLLVGPTSRDPWDAGLRDQLQGLARDHGLQDWILFRDFHPQVENYYRAADLFVLPSQNEGMPNVVVEAMACGLPCVVTSISGTTDLIEHGQSGMLFAVNSDESFMQAMRSLMHCPDHGKQIGSRAREVMVEKFSTSQVCARYLDLYHSMLNGSSR
jgi:glycosyltransferase involved in cell wall biosynthesis